MGIESGVKMKKTDILIFGDICPDNDYKELFGRNKAQVFDTEIRHMISDADFVVGNLECPATKEKEAITKCGPSLKAEPEDIAYLKELGFDAFSLANNHILDYGEKAVKDTIECCESNGLMHFGAGQNAADAAKPIVTEIKGKKIGFISFAEAEFNLAGENTPGANHFDVYTSLDDVAQLKKECDFVILLYHGGIEHYKNPSPLLQKKCRAMVKAGADLVLCQHSHCIGTVEQFQGANILYGQGNSAFGYRKGDTSWNEGFLVSVCLENKKIRLHLINAKKEGVALATPEETEERIAELKKASLHLNDEKWIMEQWVKYCQKQEALDLALLYGKGRIFTKLNRMLNNLLIRTIYGRKKQMITMNLIRCEAHHDVVTTILENNIFKSN